MAKKCKPGGLYGVVLSKTGGDWCGDYFDEDQLGPDDYAAMLAEEILAGEAPAEPVGERVAVASPDGAAPLAPHEARALARDLAAWRQGQPEGRVEVRFGHGADGSLTWSFSRGG